jgi:hypothetical protein
MMPDFKHLAAEISVQHGIRVDPDDPIMAVVTLNRIMLESAVAEAEDRIRRAASEFNNGAERLQVRAGQAVAKEVRECSAAIRSELAKDIVAAGLRAEKIVRAVDHAHSRVVHLRWAVTGVLLAIVVFLAGVAVGRVTR